MQGVDRVILLGDVLELRHGPLWKAMAAGRDFLCELGATLGEASEVVIVPGNHDHRLLAGWLERRAREGPPPPLGLESAVDWDPGEPLATIASWLARGGRVRVRAAYPGVWLREDVYAMHGHYSARHTRIPMFERLGAGAMTRIIGEAPEGPVRAEDYEATLAPIYAWIDAVAQTAGRSVARSQRTSSRAWSTLTRQAGGRSLRRRAAILTFPLAVAALNRAGLGPLQSDVSSPALARAGLRAMAETITRLEIDASYVIFGHTHRAGPLPGDLPGDWKTAAGAQMINSGSWVFDQQFVGDVPGQSPYWPGASVLLEDGAPPTLRRLLGALDPAELAPERKGQPSGSTRA